MGFLSYFPVYLRGLRQGLIDLYQPTRKLPSKLMHRICGSAPWEGAKGGLFFSFFFVISLVFAIFG